MFLIFLILIHSASYPPGKAIIIIIIIIILIIIIIIWNAFASKDPEGWKPHLKTHVMSG